MAMTLCLLMTEGFWVPFGREDVCGDQPWPLVTVALFRLSAADKVRSERRCTRRSTSPQVLLVSGQHSVKLALGPSVTIPFDATTDSQGAIGVAKDGISFICNFAMKK